MSGVAAKRFWTASEVAPEDTGFGVRLDGRPLRTPAKTPLAVPSRAMAEAIAEEWAAQGERVDPLSMPVTRAANAAIDRVVPQFEEVCDHLAEYGETDLLCYRAESPESLVQRQNAGWDPLLDWAAERYGAPLERARGVMFVPQPDASLKALSHVLRAFDPFELTAVHEFVTLTGSLILGLAAENHRMSMDDIWALSRLDQRYQQEIWGVDAEAEQENDYKLQEFKRARRFLDLHRA
ncbi:ATP12 family chaperone protein [Poseidonocella sedimentorum]|uniref:Chaperone required for the assembly of the F1-ATPase n=1 Tax=Poseidonocella sedimentorum TaxID=871652 RepID=A0A1I6DMV7_9RHOB|nr:ATP12 family protein [Poseidonocella sedimentorum]SFR06698.1 Chaperone required for the assembly of the F1-ATPase [Poseidonocella sedimentorum]